jgi:hypothetical protein
MKREFSEAIVEKYSNIKFHENASSTSRVVPCGQTDMTKLIDAFRKFANAPKHNAWNYWCSAAVVLKLRKSAEHLLSAKHHETFIFMPSLGVGTIQQKENVTLRYGAGWTDNFHVNSLGGKREIQKTVFINQLDLVRELGRECHYSISVAAYFGRARVTSPYRRPQSGNQCSTAA